MGERGETPYISGSWNGNGNCLANTKGISPLLFHITNLSDRYSMDNPPIPCLQGNARRPLCQIRCYYVMWWQCLEGTIFASVNETVS